ncbi:Charged multivesicular body protein 3 [Boothiomyces sp. JEL0838]|nr:Charged multivesicular body protein 3 [Boothiomyces sp. JEL0838]
MSALVEMLIGKKLTPEEQVKKWRQSIRAQERELDKSVRNIEKEQQNAKKLIKQAAKRNDLASCRILAKEVVASKKAINRIITSKAQLGSLAMSMQQQLAVIKVTGALEKSTQVMKVVNKLMKLPEISHTMTEMSKEMMKAGIIEEMINDTLEEQDEDIEEEAQEEVDKVLFELTDGLLGEGGIVGQDLPATQVKEDSNKEMEARLKALQSV